MADELICDVCNDEPGVGVASVPGIPMSVAYGKKCLAANAHPYGILVSHTAILGGLENTADWWNEMVVNTCKHLGKTLAEFNHAVSEEMDAEAQYWAEQEAMERDVQGE